jgi:hypothetical protein
MKKKVMQPIPDTYSVCQKINFIEIGKQKKKCWKCPPHSAMHGSALFLMFDATQ